MRKADSEGGDKEGARVTSTLIEISLLNLFAIDAV